MAILVILCLLLTSCCGECDMPAALTSVSGISGGWSSSGKLETGDRNKEVGLQANFPISQVYTVQFGVEAEDVPFNAIADITWTTEGNLVRRKISIGNGVSISAPAQACNVVVRDRTDLDIVGGNANEYKVHIKITPGVRADIEEPPTLIAGFDSGAAAVAVLAGGGTFQFDIPQDAGVTSVNVSLFTASPMVLTDADALITLETGAVILKGWSPIDKPGIWVPVPPNATTLTLTNNQPALGLTEFFSVTYGIDG